MKKTDHYWAKDNGELLLHHCLHVSRIAKKICSNLAFSIDLRQKITASLVEIGALHDIGKAVPGFQKMLKEGVLWRHRHEIISAVVASQIAPQLTAEELFAIITHHKNIPAAINENCLRDNELPFLKPNVVDSIAYELKTVKTLYNFSMTLRKAKNLIGKSKI
jgi:CRISPR-associated endonuclease Cas3-HD